MMAAPFDQPGGEPIFWEPIHKPTDRSLNIYEIIPIDLLSGIIFTYNGHPDAPLA
jgi:hypothetical protein